MTPNTNTALSNIFDVELTQTDKSLDELKLAAKQKDLDSLERQREYVKSNLIELIEAGKTVLSDMTTIARSTEQGKDYTVVTQIIKTLVETNIQLLDSEVAHKPAEIATVPGLPGQSSPAQVTNNTAVFVGTTTELAKMIRQTTIDVNNSSG